MRNAARTAALVACVSCSGDQSGVQMLPAEGIEPTPAYATPALRDRRTQATHGRDVAQDAVLMVVTDTFQLSDPSGGQGSLLLEERAVVLFDGVPALRRARALHSSATDFRGRPLAFIDTIVDRIPDLAPLRHVVVNASGTVDARFHGREVTLRSDSSTVVDTLPDGVVNMNSLKLALAARRPGVGDTVHLSAYAIRGGVFAITAWGAEIDPDRSLLHLEYTYGGPIIHTWVDAETYEIVRLESGPLSSERLSRR